MPEYREVGGHQLYCYEWDNNGEALVLLHGGLSQTSHWDQNILPAVEDQFHVFGYDRTAHGFTGDRAGSLHFDYQVKEAIAYLETVVKEPAHLIGYSDGGIIALLVAIARPDLVRTVVTLGANFHHSGTLPLPEFDGVVSPEDQAEYNETSPDAPETLVEKITRMMAIWRSDTPTSAGVAKRAGEMKPVTAVSTCHSPSTMASVSTAVANWAASVRWGAERAGEVIL